MSRSKKTNPQMPCQSLFKTPTWKEKKKKTPVKRAGRAKQEKNPPLPIRAER